MKRVMIVDAQNQFLRSYIVDPSLSSNGQPIGGSKGFLKILNKLTRTIQPDKLIVVWDGEGGSQKRRSINKNYKEGRKPIRLNRGNSFLTEEQEKQNRFWQQLRIIEYLNLTPAVQFMEPNVEADDIIAYIAKSGLFKDDQKVIISSDKDFIQLLDDKTILFRPTQDEVLNRNKVLEKYDIHPNNFALARAMAGDSSDNLKGVKGVGLATVAKRFPFMSNEKEVFVSDLLKYAADKSDTLKVFENVLLSHSLIKENYKIMQLYSPSISIQTKNRVNEVLEQHTPEFNKTTLRGLMQKDGIGEISLDSLFHLFNRITSDYSLS
jgi:DNA polymerase-1